MRDRPELVVLDVVDGVEPSDKPPVRIFLGTEPAQYRAERIFIWSIEQVRDPSRVYEIYIMKELAGFDRRRWLTGFTNYRFAIPFFAGGRGKAIWNDVDQAYLADPAELFDTDMRGCGVLTVPPLSSTSLLDTAVMLIDCEKMASIWTEEDAKHGRKNTMLAKVQSIPGLRGDLPGEWNARDEEYVPGRSKVLHWTILHTQPWHPLPQLFVYQHNPVGQVWYDMERAADEAGYQVFTAKRPSGQFRKLQSRLQHSPARKPVPNRSTVELEKERDALKNLMQKTDSGSLLEVRLACDDRKETTVGMVGDGAIPDRSAVTPVDLFSLSDADSHDGVLCEEALNHVPDEDVPWVIDSLFQKARRFVLVVLDNAPREMLLEDGSRLKGRTHDLTWWKRWFEAAAQRYPDVCWKLVFDSAARVDEEVVREIGSGESGTPVVWVLEDGVGEDTSRAIALADALAWPYEEIDTRFPLPGEKPDVVIAATAYTGAISRRLCRESGGTVRSIQIDSEGGVVADDYDVVVSPAYFHLPPHPNRIETTTRLTPVSADKLEKARHRWPRLFGQASHPRVLLLFGGNRKGLKIRTGKARQMGQEIRTFTHLAGGSVFAVIDQDTRPDLAGALVAGLGDSSHIFSRTVDNPYEDTYLAYLELADVVVVAGQNETFCADAAALGKPVYVYPVEQQSAGLTGFIREFVLVRSQSRPLNKRGTVRPQQGMEYLCARLIEKGIVSPPHDLVSLEQSLIRLGIIHPFGAAFTDSNPRAGLRVTEEAADRIRRMLGYRARAAAAADESNTAVDLAQGAAT